MEANASNIRPGGMPGRSMSKGDCFASLAMTATVTCHWEARSADAISNTRGKLATGL